MRFYVFIKPLAGHSLHNGSSHLKIQITILITRRRCEVVIALLYGVCSPAHGYACRDKGWIHNQKLR